MCEVVGPRERAPPQESRFWGVGEAEEVLKPMRIGRRVWKNMVNE